MRFWNKQNKLLMLLLFCLFLNNYSHASSGDIVFVTQVPNPQDFATIGSTFANHQGAVESAPRGGDLYIRYSDGSLKNLTSAAGYGVDGFQNAASIAVRDPQVHWSGEKIIFSMVIGSPTEQYVYNDYYWQLYEISGLGKSETPVIRKVANQPSNFNNVMPVYGTDDIIFFVSDRPRNGARHLYPQLDEYESTASNSGLWRLNPQTGELVLLDHAPSGAFNPIIDSFGRILYTRWDHLQRDQQAGDGYGAFNYASESASAEKLNSQLELFPEPRSSADVTDPNLNTFTINHFFPWQINEDGSGHETLNHIGRHELHGYIPQSFNNDGNLTEYYGQYSRFNDKEIDNFLQIREDPLHPGIYFGTDAPEFHSHASGQLISINGNPSTPADQMKITYITHRDTASYTNSPGATHTGHYRNPLPLSTGALIASHTTETREEDNDGSREFPQTRYQFRLKSLVKVGNYWQPQTALTSGISKAVSYYDPDALVTYSGPLWELQAVELVSRIRPARREELLETPEASVFAEEGVDLSAFKSYLNRNNLALIVSRNITSRDVADLQQPYNLRVTDTETKKIPRSGKVYDVSHLQLFQGDQIRGYGGIADPREGRRILSRIMHDAISLNLPNPGGPEGSVKIATDGSMAAIVPAKRALSWQLTDSSGKGIVRERYWLSFAPGEIRVCASCHGVNSRDQLGQGVPTNKPEALRQLLALFRTLPPDQTPEDPIPENPVPEEPSFSIKVSSVMKKNKVISDLLIQQQKGQIIIEGANSAAANKNISLLLNIDNTACSAPIKTLTSDINGNIKITGKVPTTKKTLALNFSVLYNNQVLVTKNVSLVYSKKKQAMLKAKDLKKICSAFSSFRR